eukprot:m.41276 g.41276  ORF g.41276 m.41276 type:complete len:499 (-) comp9750_c0_seq4:2668-4164(-)
MLTTFIRPANGGKLKLFSSFLLTLIYSTKALELSPSGLNQTQLANPARIAASNEWCDCGTCGNSNSSIEVWQSGAGNRYTVNRGGPVWISWPTPVDTIQFRCTGSQKNITVKLDKKTKWWTLRLWGYDRSALGCEKKLTGRVFAAGWQEAAYNTSVVYSSGENGYFCIKIPVLLFTANGTLLAFAEARRDSCSDFAWTDLVVKSSRDFGVTWGAMQVIRSESGPNLPKTVIGNAAPVQLFMGKYIGRIVVPHTRNNTDVWVLHSDDDGQTWSQAREIPNVTLPEWKWVGTGPPGSIQLKHTSGRLLVPSYHGRFRGNLINNIVHGHVMLSDDSGDTWRLGAAHGFGDAKIVSNENQAVELANGSVLINARSLANPLINQYRVQTVSLDGGETFGVTHFVKNLPQPIDGCEGSTVRLDSTNTLYYSGPNSDILRANMSIWYSKNDGESWVLHAQIDPGESGYSSLQTITQGRLGLLYEQSDSPELVMNPDRFIFRLLEA